MISSEELRKKFLDYFAHLNHKVVESTSLVPAHDPTILFTTAGMVQFKKFFLDASTADYRRACSAQRCFRTSDIEKVGTTLRHLTFFEMLGNFSFGDYFKKEAIQWCWEFLTREVKLPQKQLYATVYKDDEESYGLWRRFLPSERVAKLGGEDNFWQLGETGPCGPCSEILFDQGEEVGCGRPGCAPGCDCDRWLEVWNLVFTQYDRQEDGNLTALPQKNIDTGMGLERLSAVVNGRKDPFETDLFLPIIQQIEKLSGRKYHQTLAQNRAIRIIADHIRGIVFLLNDGILPSNEGRGYVLRRILRRAVRQGRVIGIQPNFLSQLVSSVVGEMKSIYPDLLAHQEQITQIIRLEEEKFHKTLDAGLEKIKEIIAALPGKVIPGEEVFRLYDTYGFPLDLTKEVAGEQGLELDLEGFNHLLQQQQARAREGWEGAVSQNRPDDIYQQIHKCSTDTVFRGYEVDNLSSYIIAIIKDGQEQDSAKVNEKVEIVLAETPFYAEAGGQVGDRGWIIKPVNLTPVAIHTPAVSAEIEVYSTFRFGEGLVVQQGVVKKGAFKTKEAVLGIVNVEDRDMIRRNHTATHLLQAVLRRVLGKGVHQSGSLVSAERLRFDYTYPAQPGESQLSRIEEAVNKTIRENLPVFTTETSREHAQKVGAMALFGEKYADRVRMVVISSFGLDVPEKAFSIELCGGTHCRATGEIGLFKIVSDSSIASGVRRIEALTGQAACQYVQEEGGLLKRVSEILRAPKSEVVAQAEKIIKTNKQLQKQLQTLRAGPGGVKIEELLDKVRTIDGIKVLSTQVDGMDMGGLRSLGDRLKSELKSGVIVLGSVTEKKVLLLAVVTRDLVKKGFDAVKIINPVAQIVGGKGGGRADFAQAGGKIVEKLDEALSQVDSVIKNYETAD